MSEKRKLKTIFFAHSAGAQYGTGKGSYDLVKYMRSSLDGEYKILFPKIHLPNSPTYQKYKTMFDASFNNIKGPIILVGHSLGASTLLKYLSEEKSNFWISGLFLASTPHWKSNMKEFELKKDSQWHLKNIKKIFIYRSTHDPIIPLDHLQFYKKSFPSAIVREIPGKEHIFSKGLPKMVADIKAL